MRVLGLIIVVAIGLGVAFKAPSSRGDAPLYRLTIKAADNKIFYTDVTLFGTAKAVRIRSMVDTGASSLSIMCDQVAKDLALPLGPEVTVLTANGKKIARRVIVPAVRVGAIELRDVSALISRQVDDHCMVLVGNSFLQRLQSVTLNGDRLQLVGRSSQRRGRSS
jgi:clan AA aspartic protease (TIGR02281 family)